MTTAIITGITGQDGSYLTEMLLQKGYRIIGAIRDVQKAKSIFPITLADKIEFVGWDMLDHNNMIGVLSRYRPNEVYNFAAYSSGTGMFDDAIGIGDVNGLAVTRMLDAIRSVNTSIRFCQASSSEMFGETLESPQSETSPFRPRSPYGAAKLYAHSMINIYRTYYDIFACSAILFNHESPRRGLGFVSRKVSHEVAKIKLGLATELSLGNMEARRDWGFAGDYVRAMWQMLQEPEADDYVIATGMTYSVRQLCEIAFAHVGLNYLDYVREDVNAYRPTECFQLVGDTTKAREKLGWSPKVDLHKLVTMMVDADLRLLGSNNI